MLLALGCSSDPGTAISPDAAGGTGGTAGSAGADAGMDAPPTESGSPDSAPFVCWYGDKLWTECDGGYGCVDGTCLIHCETWDPICPARGGTCVDGWCHPPDGGAP